MGIMIRNIIFGIMKNWALTLALQVANWVKISVT